MKVFLTISLLAFSVMAFAETAEVAPVKKNKVIKLEVNKKQKPVEAAKVEPKTAATTAPCDSKEDLLKKLEEKKKAESEKGKGFSLQGGNTGCSVK